MQQIQQMQQVQHQVQPSTSQSGECGTTSQPVPPPTKKFTAPSSGRTSDKKAAIAQQKELLKATSESDNITDQVRVSDFVNELLPLIKVFLQVGYKTYRQLPLPTGMHNYIPVINKKHAAFTQFMQSTGVNYAVETTCIRIAILQAHGNLLIDNADEKRIQLSGLVDFVWNVYLNKRQFPTDFTVQT